MVANLDSMAFTGVVPWHGFGTKLDKEATSAEAMVAAKLDWTVEKKPIFLKDGTEIKGRYATVRTDKNVPLGIIGETYCVLQNKDAFSFFDAIVGIKAAMYQTAGSLGSGERIWLLAKLPGYIKVKSDISEKYLLLTNSHNGTSAVSIMFTPIRVVCQNTLNIAISGVSKEQGANIRHSVMTLNKVKDVQDKLGVMNYQYQIFEELSNKLANIKMNTADFDRFLEGIGMMTKDAENKITTRAQNIMEEVSNLWEHGRGNDQADIKHTAWTAFNAVAEYADYYRSTRGKNEAAKSENKCESLLFGSGAALKQKAWDHAVGLVK